MEDPRYLELVTRGLLWACGKLKPEYLRPYQGENKVTFIEKKTVQAPPAIDLGKAPKDATLVKVTASSTQSGNDAYRAIDGSRETRWCADGGSYPQWLQLEFEQPHALREIQIAWEFPDKWYKYKVEGSTDGKTWSMLLDQSTNTANGQSFQQLVEQPAVKFVRVTALAGQGGWCSIWELKLNGEGIGTLWPADAKGRSREFAPTTQDPFAKEGNIVPRIEKLSSEQEAEILKGVKVPKGFEVTLFAAPPAVNYPVFVAADPSGVLYVSSDGNGSLGRQPLRGRVIRLRDLDGDGSADETKVFCEVDAPRGLVWDHDRLYLMHPPHLSAFIDHDGDGVADEEKVLVKNLAFGYDQRPADHTTNGVSLGADGWLYIAGGDFGFMNAEGTDGRKLTHRGGGVIRVRPDGTGLEVYSTGTRNILEVAISPQMEMFARDNTNDGGGWDVRLHHFTGMEDHGYPRLYRNFNNECVQPLADYGGGSGCGSVYIDEPGFGKWNNAPFTADWGTGSLYRHNVEPHGATYQETQSPEPFISLTRPTDADVDGNSRVYCASWKGATFNWAGPDVGFVVCVKPKGFQPDPLPDFAKASDAELIALLQTPSYRRRVEAERELMRRGNPEFRQLLESGVAQRTEPRKSLERLQAAADESDLIQALGADDPVIVHTAIRCLAKRQSYAACFESIDKESAPTAAAFRALAMMHQPEVVEGLLARLSKTTSPKLRHELWGSLCRLHFQEGDWKGDSWGTRPDTRGPYYQPEAWSETPKIAAALQAALIDAEPEEAAVLVELMHRNRIESSVALARMLQLARNDDRLLGPAITQLAARSELPREGLNPLLKAARKNDLPPAVLIDVIVSLAKCNDAESPAALLAALVTLEDAKLTKGDRSKVREAFVNSPYLDVHAAAYAQAAQTSNGDIWADIALLAISAKASASPEARELAQSAIAEAWKLPAGRRRMMQAAAVADSHYLDDRIWRAQEDQDKEVAMLARSTVRQLKIKPRAADNTPKVRSLSPGDVLSSVVDFHGDVDLGRQVFLRANCAACHTVSQQEVQKGPFLGAVVKTYKRPELATSILEPSKTIAQGFATNTILTTDGLVLTGYVTNELSDRVTMRDQQGKEHTVMKDEIEARKTSPVSVMPTGMMNDFTTHELASLLDYLQSLSPAAEGK